MKTWAELDASLIWHPYSQHGSGAIPLPIQSAEGAYLTLTDGRKVIDGIASWWVNIHGHGHPAITQAIARQAATLDHVIFSGFTHEPAVQLADLLITSLKTRNIPLDRVFYSDNGSTAVEVALKLAFQHHFNRGEKKRTRFIALRGAYHGDTLGAMAVGEPDGFHALFRKILPPVDFVTPDQLEELIQTIDQYPDQHAAFIFEPLLQGAGGMKLYSAKYLREAVDICQAKGILTIADEVFTGFYRTGKAYAIEHAGIQPDFLCLSKGITGGVLPLAVTLTREEIFRSFWSTELKTAFLHGHSYTANPIACAAALASWQILHSEACQAQIRVITQETTAALQRLKSHPKVREVRQIGTVGALELQGASGYFSGSSVKVLQMAVDRGVLLRPLGNVLYTVPPYCTTAAEMQKIYAVMEEIIHAY